MNKVQTPEIKEHISMQLHNYSLWKQAEAAARSALATAREAETLEQAGAAWSDVWKNEAKMSSWLNI